jgi:hypothetical protein
VVGQSYGSDEETKSTFFYFSITESGTGCILALMEVECRKVGWGKMDRRSTELAFGSD